MSLSATSLDTQHTTKTFYKILFIISICHLLNDTLQAVVPAMFPVLEKNLGLNFTQLGIIAAVLNIVSSIFQPVVGWYADKKSLPYILPFGLACSLIGMFLLGIVPSYGWIVCSVIFVGIGSAVFHPEGSRVVHLAAGSQKGLAQSIYQVGGNSGQALAPVITALVLVPLGQIGAIWFTSAAAIAVLLLIYIARWYSAQLKYSVPKQKPQNQKQGNISRPIWVALGILLFVLFARSWYIASMTNFYTFYVIKNYHLSIKDSQVFLFAFLISGAVGTFFGGPLADKFGMKNIIIFSLIGSAPLAIILPHVGPILAFILLLFTGFIIMASFSVSVVYAQKLVPSKIGTMSGLTVGLIFGMGAVCSVIMGKVADIIGITLAISIVGFLPLLGFFSFLLPSDEEVQELNQN